MDFDSRANSWDKDRSRLQRAHEVAEAIRARVAPGPQARVLEYGCGTGLLGFALQPSVGSLLLVDSAEGMLAVAREKIERAGLGDRVDTRQLDLTRDPLPAQRFDLIVSLLTLHHVADTAALLRAFRALLVPGGHLCIADLDAEDGSFHGEGFDGHNGFEREALAALAESAGFVRPTFETVLTLSRLRDGETRDYPVFLMVAEAG